MTWLNRTHFGDCRDSMRKMIAAGVRVNCIVTSPPYWGLRDYGTATWEGGDAACDHKGKPVRTTANINRNTGTGNDVKNALKLQFFKEFCGLCGALRVDSQIGLENTPEEYVEHLVEVFSLARGLLTDDGVLWLNLGDSYANDSKWGGATGGKHAAALHGTNVGRGRRTSGLKSKDLCEIPSDVVRALRADGWWLRSRMPWVKRNGMPESATDRPANSVEYVFLLTKSEQCFYDNFAVKMPQAEHERTRRLAEQERGLTTKYQLRRDSPHGQHAPGATGCARSVEARQALAQSGVRNWRTGDGFLSTWQGMATDDGGDPMAFVVNTRPYKGAHFAAFPPLLIEPCILAGTSAHGHCQDCGAGWERVLEKGAADLAHQQACGGDAQGEYHGDAVKEYAGTGAQNASAVKARILQGMRQTSTVGWRPTCICYPRADEWVDIPKPKNPESPTDSELLEIERIKALRTELLAFYRPMKVIKAVLLDMFGGSGTTAQVAQQFGRDWILCELNQDYESLQQDRTRQMGMAL
jgi:DNA modification methylase